jgi:hypothetical protein
MLHLLAEKDTLHGADTIETVRSHRKRIYSPNFPVTTVNDDFATQVRLDELPGGRHSLSLRAVW